MLLDPSRLEAAVADLQALGGALHDLGYIDAATEDWGGAVTLATEFIYFHELGHLSQSIEPGAAKPDWVLPDEQYLLPELLADQFAFAMVALRSHRDPDLEAVSMASISLAMSLVALQEFVDTEKANRRSIKDSVLRMGRLLYWGRLCAGSELTAQAVEVGGFYWELFRTLLGGVQDLQSPVFDVLRDAADGSRPGWATARNSITRWCAFGDRDRVAAALRKVKDRATAAANSYPTARTVLGVLDAILDDTRALEPELGLEALR
jgi:hypothetical protein